MPINLEPLLVLIKYKWLAFKWRRILKFISSLYWIWR